MLGPSQAVPTSFSLAAVFCWGTSDFLGGILSRRANAFLVTTIVHASGFTFAVVFALIVHAPFLSSRSLAWALLAGACGGAALALFYRALSVGNMGLIAPVAAVLSAAIPTFASMFFEGVPGHWQIAGFILAGAGIWLISRSEGSTRPEGLGLAALCGVGFAAFYLCIKQASDGSALWAAASSRAASLAITAVILVWSHGSREIKRNGSLVAVVAGFLDVGGTMLFIRAAQTGRLDSAVVLASLYPTVTVVLARIFLKEHFSRWRAVGIFAALLAVPLIAVQ
jgi:drug/metabolite transporter (DMT)-like permease